MCSMSTVHKMSRERKKYSDFPQTLKRQQVLGNIIRGRARSFDTFAKDWTKPRTPMTLSRVLIMVLHRKNSPR